MNPKRFSIVCFFFALAILVQCKDKKATFILQKEIKIEATDEAAIKTVGQIIMTEKSIILSDIGNNYVYEFDPEGKYIRTIGRHGQGPGEYMDIRYVTTDNPGHIIVCDNSDQGIHIYDKEGQYIDDLNRSRTMNHTKMVEFLPNQELIQLKTFYGADQLNKYRFGDLSVIFSMNPAPEKYQIINLHFGRRNPSVFKHSPKYSSIYFISPCDYRIKEIDDQDGVVKKIFGVKPKSFRTLPRKYHTLKEIGDTAILRQIMNSVTLMVPTSFQILNERYLFVGYVNRNEKWEFQTEWQVYDLENVEKPLKITNDVIFSNENIFCAKDETLVVYTKTETDDSNGTIHLYSIDISD